MTLFGCTGTAGNGVLNYTAAHLPYEPGPCQDEAVPGPGLPGKSLSLSCPCPCPVPVLVLPLSLSCPGGGGGGGGGGQLLLGTG